jgi:hypothetical protein
LVTDPLRYLIGRPWRDVSLPPDAVGIPTMLSKGERRLLYGLARDYAGAGAIVDAGCFLGGSTAALLAGVRDRERPWAGPPVASYDLFRVEGYTIRKFFADDPHVRIGDSFRPRFDRAVAGFDVPHDVHEGDITEIGWSGAGIDVLFLDVLKSWDINDSVLRDFFPSLMPGRSVIVHQDYGGAYMPWIPITVELMRDSIVLVDWMEWGTHVFFVEDELPAELMEHGVAGLDLERRFELVDQAVGRADGWVRGMLELSRTALVVERSGVDAGVADLAEISERYRPYRSVVSAAADVKEALETNGTFGFATGTGRWGTRLAWARRRVAAAFRGR